MLFPTFPGQRRLVLIGWALYAVSWVTPGLNASGIGARAFVGSVQYATRYLWHPQSVKAFALGLCVLFGWLANFSIFVPLAARTRVAWLAAPWFPFLGALLLADAPPAVREHIFSLLYFYPWALGIACIHIGMMQKGGTACLVLPSSTRP